MANDRMVPANRTSPRQQVQRDHARVNVVFRLWQCDKENHGWREGPPVTVLWQSFRSAGRAFTLRQRQFRTKKEYRFAMLAASPHSEHWPVYNDHSRRTGPTLPILSTGSIHPELCFAKLRGTRTRR